MPGVESVSVGLWLAVGGRHEAQRVHGVSHFLEHMLFKGTRRRTAKEISQAIEGVGGYLNAFTAEEMTCYMAKASARHLPVMIDVLLDMLLQSTFPAEEMARERGVIIEEIRMYNDQPAQVAAEKLGALLWPGHPLGRSLTGTPEIIARLPRAELVRHCRRYYTKGNLWIVVAGKTDLAEVRRLLRPWLAKIPSGRRVGAVPFRGNGRRPAVEVVRKEVEQAQLALGVRGVSRHDPRRYAMRLLSVLLGENMSSRLFQSVRERHGLAYEIGTSVGYFLDAGQLVITAGMENRNVEKGLRLMLRELARLTERAPSAQELRRAKDYMLGQFYMGLESTHHRMLWLGETLIAHGRVRQPDEIARLSEAVTARQIQELASEIFRTERLAVAGVSGELETRQVREWAQLRA